MKTLYIDPMKEENKDLVQSFQMTTLRNDFGVFGQRTLVRLVEAAQPFLEGHKIGDCVKFEVTEDLWGYRRIKMPITAILPENDTTNYTKAKKELKQLVEKSVTFESETSDITVALITRVDFDKVNGDAILDIAPEIWSAILDFSKGFRRFEMAKVLQLRSAYSMRLYQLMSGQERPLEYSLDNLKRIFGLENKYQNKPLNFISRVIVPAKEELDRLAPYSFDFKPILERKSGKGKPGIAGIRFYPYFIPGNRDKDLAIKEDSWKNAHHKDAMIQRIFSLEQGTKNYLMHTLGFSQRQLDNNRVLFLTAATKIKDFDSFLRGIAPRANHAKNPQGYVINSIKLELQENGVKI